MKAAALPALPALIEAMHERRGPQNTFDTFVTQAFGEMGPSAVPALTRALGDSSPRLREAAAYGLGMIGVVAAPAVPALTDLLGDPDVRVQWAAVMALGAIGPAAAPAIPALKKLRDQDPSQSAVVHGALVKILGNAAGRGRHSTEGSPTRSRRAG